MVSGYIQWMTSNSLLEIWWQEQRILTDSLLQLLLKNVFIRRGIAWLEPANIELKGYQTEERQVLQDADFIRGLHLRLGLVVPFTTPTQC